MSEVKRQKYSVKFKAEAVDLANRTSVTAAAKKLKVTRKMVREWKANIDDLKAAGPGTKADKRCRVAGGGRKLMSNALDARLKDWYNDAYERRDPISRRILLLQSRAIRAELLDENPDLENLKLSKGWLDGFCQRHRLVLRRRTTVCQKAPVDFVEKVCDFILYTRKLIKDEGVHANAVYGMDETSVWLDPAASTTIAPVGVRDVSIRGVGHDKVRITVALTAKADGKKCLPFVLLNRKRVIPEIADQFRGKLNLCWAGRVWMDDSLTETYLRQTIGPQLFQKRVLIWDSFRCHRSEKTKDVLHSLKVLTSIVPGGCTKFVQPADVSWNRPFKLRIQEMHDDWLGANNLPQTAGGNYKPPSPAVYLTWVYEAWQAVSEEVIRNSFRHCGISLTSSAEDDDSIHMFAAHGPCPQGRATFDARKAAGSSAVPDVVSRVTIDSGSETEDMSTDASVSEADD